MLMKTIFTKLATNYCSNNRLIEQLWNEINSVYTHPKRYYHNFNHLQHLYDEFLEVKDEINDWNTVLFSLFFHDIVYNALRRDNEERSVIIAENRLQSIDVPQSIIDAVKEQILATKSHKKSQDSDTNYFIDADLSILGQDFKQYGEYVTNIRQEYILYPDMIYKPGRKKVVEDFLQMDRIFKTDYFYNKYEKQARENLQLELEEMSVTGYLH